MDVTECFFKSVIIEKHGRDVRFSEIRMRAEDNTPEARQTQPPLNPIRGSEATFPL